MFITSAVSIYLYRDHSIAYYTDDRTRYDLSTLDHSVNIFVQNNKRLPSTSSEALQSATIINYTYFTLDANKYSYKKLSEYDYQICATFINDVTYYPSIRGDSSPYHSSNSTDEAILNKYTKGLNCFNLTLNPESRNYIVVKDPSKS